MKALSTIIALFGIQCVIFAGSETNRFDLAKQAHMEKRFEDAIHLLEKETKAQPNNPAVYFNLGLAYKAEKQFPKAIWAFEKTLKFNPKDSEAIQLIESSYTEMDKNLTWKDTTGTFQRALIALGSNFWSILAVVFSILAAAGVIMAKRTRKNNKRKWYLGTTVFAIVTLFICAANASSSYDYEHNHNYAIVLDSVELKGKNSREKLPRQLQPGAKVQVLSWNKDGSASVNAQGGTIKVQKGLAKI